MVLYAVITVFIFIAAVCLLWIIHTNGSYCVVAKPIDLLARYISAEDDDIAIEMHEPYTYLNVSKPNTETGHLFLQPA